MATTAAPIAMGLVFGRGSVVLLERSNTDELGAIPARAAGMVDPGLALTVSARKYAGVEIESDAWRYLAKIEETATRQRVIIYYAHIGNQSPSGKARCVQLDRVPDVANYPTKLAVEIAIEEEIDVGS